LNLYFSGFSQLLGYENIMGDGNTLAAQIGLSTTNLNQMTYIFGIIIYGLCIFGLYGLDRFVKCKREGWYIVFLLSIPLTACIIGIFFINYLINSETHEKYDLFKVK